MNALDIVIAVILGFCLIRGIFRGLIKELSSIVGVLGGFYGAFTYYAQVAQLLSRWVSSSAYRNILSFFLIFCGVLLVVGIIGIVIKYLLRVVSLGWADRISGAVFGLLKAVLIASVLLVSLTAFLPRRAPIVADSVLAPHITMISEQMARVVSPEMKRSFDVKVAELKKLWQRRR
ncbi:MAG: CvpA family protein [Desulfobacterales bacterium]|nr:CvpA family protein [Desulfobacterales bacterium]